MSIELTPVAWLHADPPCCGHIAYHKGDCSNQSGTWHPLYDISQVRSILLDHMAELSVLTTNVGRLLEIAKEQLKEGTDARSA